MNCVYRHHVIIKTVFWHLPVCYHALQRIGIFSNCQICKCNALITAIDISMIMMHALLCCRTLPRKVFGVRNMNRIRPTRGIKIRGYVRKRVRLPKVHGVTIRKPSIGNHNKENVQRPRIMRMCFISVVVEYCCLQKGDAC